jgi:hypothetical protein
MTVFQTAKSVLVVSPVVLVVISFVATPPLLRLQPPNIYPARLVLTVLAKDSVETLSESVETRVAASLTGTEVARVLPSKTIVGFAAVVALAEEGIAVNPARASRPIRTAEVVFLDSDMILELRTVAIGFPSMIRFFVARCNFRPMTLPSYAPTGCKYGV